MLYSESDKADLQTEYQDNCRPESWTHGMNNGMAESCSSLPFFFIQTGVWWKLQMQRGYLIREYSLWKDGLRCRCWRLEYASILLERWFPQPLCSEQSVTNSSHFYNIAGLALRKEKKSFPEMWKEPGCPQSMWEAGCYGWLMVHIDERQTQAAVICNKIFSNQAIIRHFHHDNSLPAETGVLILVAWYLLLITLA